MASIRQVILIIHQLLHWYALNDYFVSQSFLSVLPLATNTHENGVESTVKKVMQQTEHPTRSSQTLSWSQFITSWKWFLDRAKSHKERINERIKTNTAWGMAKVWSLRYEIRSLRTIDLCLQKLPRFWYECVEIPFHSITTRGGK